MADILSEKQSMPRIGAQFFVNPDDSIEDVEKHFSIMEEYGIRLVRLFILWDHIEPKQNEFVFDKYDVIYAAAERHNIQIVSTITAEDPPTWFKEKPFYHHYCNLNDNNLKVAASIYIKELVSHFKDHKAQYAWILMNEPEVYVNFEPSTMQEFAKWLKNKYHTIENMNLKWYKHFSCFEEVIINEKDVNEYWQCFYAYTDWLAFLKDNLVTQLEFIKKEIQKYDKKSLLHINPKGFFGNLAPVGQDYWKENKVCDILGASIHPAWKFTWFNRNEYGLAFSFCTDIIRSAAEKNPFWVTELQSGATLMTGIQPCTPTPDEITEWLWDSVGSGAKSVIYWMWHPRTFGQEAGEWGIVTANHHISKRLVASSKVSKIIEDNGELFAEAKPKKARVCVLYNHATEVLSLIEGSPLYRTPEAPIKSLTGVYMALKSKNIDVDFISEDQILNDKLNEYKYLYLPYCYALNKDVQMKISDFVKDGGNLWAEPPCAWKNDCGEIFRDVILSKTLGFEFNEFEGCRCDNYENDLPYLCTADIIDETAQTIKTFSDGTPKIIENNYYKGKIRFVNTVASLGYFETKNPEFKRLITSFVENSKDDDFEFFISSTNVITRILISQNKRIVILENWGEKISLQIKKSAFNYTNIKSLYENTNYSFKDDILNVTLKQNETAVFVFE